MQKIEELDELQKVIAETNLKLYELSGIKDSLQGLVEDIRDLENRFEKIRQLLTLQTARDLQRRMEATANV